MHQLLKTNNNRNKTNQPNIQLSSNNNKKTKLKLGRRTFKTVVILIISAVNFAYIRMSLYLEIWSKCI